MGPSTRGVWGATRENGVHLNGGRSPGAGKLGMGDEGGGRREGNSGAGEGGDLEGFAKGEENTTHREGRGGSHPAVGCCSC